MVLFTGNFANHKTSATAGQASRGPRDELKGSAEFYNAFLASCITSNLRPMSASRLVSVPCRPHIWASPHVGLSDMSVSFEVSQRVKSNLLPLLAPLAS